MSAKSQQIRVACDIPNRQRQVLKLLANGFNTKESAAKLGISTKCVEWHRTNLMNKSGLFSWAELTKLALRIGLTEIDV